MTDIGYYHTSLATHEIVVSKIGREVEIRTGSYGIVDKRAAGTGTYGNAPHTTTVGDSIMTHGTHTEQRLHATQKSYGVLLRRQMSHHTESDRVIGRRRLQHTHLTDPYHFAHTPAHAAARTVEIGMACVKSYAAAYGTLDTTFDVRCRIEPLQCVEHYRVVSDYQIATFGLGLVEHSLSNIDGEKSAMHFIVITSHYKAGIIIRLLQRQRSEPFDSLSYISDLHSLKQ